jgi:hypothetical protein
MGMLSVVGFAMRARRANPSETSLTLDAAPGSVIQIRTKPFQFYDGMCDVRFMAKKKLQEKLNHPDSIANALQGVLAMVAYEEGSGKNALMAEHHYTIGIAHVDQAIHHLRIAGLLDP